MISYLVLTAFLASPQPIATSLPEYLRKHGFSDQELAAVEGGRPVVKLLEAENDTETQILGVVKIQGEPEEFIDRYRDIVNFEKGTGVVQIGLFRDPLRVEDLERLTLDREDVEDVKECRPGNCAIKMSDRTIEAFQQFDWKASDSVPRAEKLARQMIVDFVNAYQQGGNEALGTLHDKKKPLRVKQQFEEMIESPDLPVYFPSLYAFLKDYPEAPIPGAEELFYWSKVDFGLKPLIRLNHVVIYPPEDHDNQAIRYCVASKMIYTTHYFNTGLEMKCLLVTPESPGAYYLVSMNQSRSDGLTGFTGSLIGRTIRGKAREGLESYLGSVKRNLEE